MCKRRGLNTSLETKDEHKQVALMDGSGLLQVPQPVTTREGEKVTGFKGASLR